MVRRTFVSVVMVVTFAAVALGTFRWPWERTTESTTGAGALSVSSGAERPRGWTLERDPYLLETSVPGIFVAGDVRQGSVKRVASGVGEGAIAVQFIHQYLANV